MNSGWRTMLRAASVCLTAMVVSVVVSARRVGAQTPQVIRFVEVTPPVVDSIVHAYTHPDYRGVVDSAANVIVDSTASLDRFLTKLVELREGGDGVVSVLHVGDSHVQAGFFTGRVRELIQADFGDAGRGLITPYRMAGMNEPRDYAITARYGCTAAKATDREAPAKGFTGVDVSFKTPYNELTVRSNTPFTGVTLLHDPAAPVLDEPDWLDIGSYCTIDNTRESSYIPLSRSVDSLTLSGFTCDTLSRPTFYGFVLDNGQPGVLYHSLGLNSAAFEHMDAVARGGAGALRPDLIIISLGTNNSFGSNYREGHLYNVIDRFVREVKSAYPAAAVLLTTPMEACRRVGRRRVPNPNVVETGRIIRDVAVANDVACWDLYAATGGEGAMTRWAADGLVNTDRIHLTEAGYALHGDMLYDALARLFNQFIAR